MRGVLQEVIKGEEEAVEKAKEARRARGGTFGEPEPEKELAATRRWRRTVRAVFNQEAELSSKYRRDHGRWELSSRKTCIYS